MVKAAASPTAAAASASGFDDLAMAKIVEETAGPLPKTTMRAVFRELVSGCRALVRPLRIALSGTDL